MGYEEFISIKQYSVLAGAYEADVSGTFSLVGNTVTFTPACPWSYNKEIHIIVEAGLEGASTNALQSDYESIFTTVFYPMYSSAILVKMTGGALLDPMKNDPINRLILEHSIIMQNLWYEDINDCDIPWFITRYVTCKVAYEILSGNIQQYIGSAISKRLGDFEIEGIRDVPGLIRPKLQELSACITSTMAFILNQGKLHASPKWSARAKQALEGSTHLNRVPFRTPSTKDMKDISSEQYYSDGPGAKKLGF